MYDAVMVAVPAVEDVKVEVQVALSVVVPTARLQLGKVPVIPDTAKATKPVGVEAPVVDVSVTVIVHVEACPMTTGLAQVTAVLVGLSAEVTIIVSVLLVLPL